MTNYKLKAKNFWRKNQRLITLIAIAGIVGLVLALGNTLYYNQQSLKYSLDSPQNINRSASASFEFNISNPELTSETLIVLEISNVTEDMVLGVKVNGNEVEAMESETASIKIPRDRLRRENTVTISKKDIFDSHRLIKARVTSRTSLQQLAYVVLNFAAMLLIFLPIGYVKYQGFRNRKKMEEEFPAFLRDIVEGTRAGMSLPQAVRNTESGGYDGLEEQIEKMSAQIEWGVPFDDVLTQFGRETKSPVIKRSVDTIIQAYTSGGNIQDVLESVGDNIRSIRQLKEERQSQLYGEMITGYIVYFIFIGILIALTTYLLPNLAAASGSLGGGIQLFGSGGGSSLQENIELYRVWFSRLVFIQAIFSGLIIGKLSSGEFRAGFKHVAILFAIGYLSVTFFL